ncbi:peptidyl-prolyl cis-trans isomerase fkbp43 [Phtheirospermum japonicum]|uniref:Peptidyl-prolyl cis-trans isomerase fkbp43 n=1 Tax=Phtheirospermum japonicum TaxID=374723 RepID=A0A830C8T9_9LAMI|nr:peptidyl-prolyl cis-trans isomerase fkbp43 [Phtheirospermum japonicum]
MNVGKRSLVLLCALLPNKTESCHLDLEFEEPDDVVFSVIGPRSVYLICYYIQKIRQSNTPSDTESYGMDMENTYTEGSSYGGDDENYDDSFINDDAELQFSPRSPVNNEDIDGDTALHVAVCQGLTDVVGLLLRRGAQVDVNDRWGNTIDEVRQLIGPQSGKLALYGSDASILRYLRARNWSVKKAVKMLKASLKRRLEYKPKEICWWEQKQERFIDRVTKISMGAFVFSAWFPARLSENGLAARVPRRRITKRGGQWNSGGNYDGETRPIMNNAHLGPYP